MHWLWTRQQPRHHGHGTAASKAFTLHALSCRQCQMQIPGSAQAAVCCTTPKAQQEQQTDVARRCWASKTCMACNTYVAGKSMQQCPVCRQWSCSAPCRSGSAGLVAACLKGRPQTQGAGLRWSCPHPRCQEPEDTASATTLYPAVPPGGPRPPATTCRCCRMACTCAEQ